MRLAVTGHRGLPPDVATLIERDIRAELERIEANGGGLIGLSCLADGADQIFATAVLDRGGRLEVVVPATAYRDGLPDDAKPVYDGLFSRADRVHRLHHHDSTPDAHMAASTFLVDQADRVLAVWDGQPSRAFGGTADVVAYATDHGVPVTVIWPEGARRD